LSNVTTSERRVVLVTGATSGFGRLMVETLARRGHCVFAGLRDITGRNMQASADLTALASREAIDLQVVELDVTDQSSVEQAIATVIGAAARIDVVVNNAGMIMPGPLEAFTADEAQRQFDVNVFGALRVNRAVLPQLRQQGHGVMIQIGSLAGRVTLPYSGLYAASKAALASLTEAWHQELAPFGIESVIVEPAPYRTSIGANAIMPEDTSWLGIYGERFGRFVADLGTAQAGIRAEDSVEVTDSVVILVEMANGQRPRRTTVAPGAQAEAIETLNASTTATARVISADMGVASYVTD